jgi:uncharacterized protein
LFRSVRPTDGVVAVRSRHPVIVVLLAALTTALAATYAARHFTKTANTEELISPKIDWRRRVLDFQAVFPQLEGPTLIAIDGKTLELADRAAQHPADALRSKPRLDEMVEVTNQRWARTSSSLISGSSSPP